MLESIEAIVSKINNKNDTVIRKNENRTIIHKYNDHMARKHQELIYYYSQMVNFSSVLNTCSISRNHLHSRNKTTKLKWKNNKCYIIINKCQICLIQCMKEYTLSKYRYDVCLLYGTEIEDTILKKRGQFSPKFV